MVSWETISDKQRAELERQGVSAEDFNRRAEAMERVSPSIIQAFNKYMRGSWLDRLKAWVRRDR